LIFELLPVLEGWAYYPLKADNRTISKGSIKKLWSREDFGWILRAKMVCDSAYVRLKLKILGGKGTSEISGQPYELYTWGFTAPNNSYFYCAKYDSANNVYVVVYAPETPWPYSGLFEASIEMPSDAAEDTSTITLDVDRIVVVDQERFINSLKNNLYFKGGV
jgi:hypothetical protein